MELLLPVLIVLTSVLIVLIQSEIVGVLLGLLVEVLLGVLLGVLITLSMILMTIGLSIELSVGLGLLGELDEKELEIKSETLDSKGDRVGLTTWVGSWVAWGGGGRWAASETPKSLPWSLLPPIISLNFSISPIILSIVSSSPVLNLLLNHYLDHFYLQ